MSDSQIHLTEEMMAPLEEAELDELADILASRGDGEGIALDSVHGFLTAAVIGPAELTPAEWMPTIIDDGRAFSTLEDAERAVTLLLRLHRNIIDDLERLSYEPILGQEESESGELVLTAHGWCAGFSLGVDLRGETWQARMRDDARLLELLDPVVRLATDEGVFDAADGEDVVPLSENEYDDAISHLASSIIDVQQYWREHPADALLHEDEDDTDIVPHADASPGTPHVVPRHRGGRSVH